MMDCERTEDGRYILTAQQIGDLQVSEFKIGWRSGRLSVTSDESAISAGAAGMSDLLVMLNVDPDEVPEHGGPSTAEVLSRAVLRAAVLGESAS